MTKIVSIVDNKGGTGKTTTTVNLAAALSLKKKKVLVVDNDPQGDSTDYLLDRKAINISKSLFDIYKNNINDLSEAIYPTVHSNLDIIPNRHETAFLEIELARKFPESFNTLKHNISRHVNNLYDFVLIDCPPTLSIFVSCALFCSDATLAPIDIGSTKSLKGVQAILFMMDEIKKNGNPDLKFLKILISKLDKRKAAHKKNTNTLDRVFDQDKIFKTRIPTSTVFEQIDSMYFETIFSYKPRSMGAVAYKKLADEFLKLF